MNNIIYMIVACATIFSNLNLFSQLTFPAPDYYGTSDNITPTYPTRLSCGAFSTVPGTPITSSSSTRYQTFLYPNVLVTKKSTSNISFLFDIRNCVNVYNNLSTSYVIDNSSTYAEINQSYSYNTPTNSNYGYSSNFSGGGTLAPYIPAADETYISNSFNNTTLVNPPYPILRFGQSINTIRGILMKQNIEYSTIIKLWDKGDFRYGCNGTFYFTNLKKRQDVKFIVTDPKNWTSFQTADYDIINGNASNGTGTAQNGTSKQTRFAELLGGSNQAGMLLPSGLLNSLPDTNIWNSRLGYIELYSRPQGSTGAFQYNNIGKAGINWSSTIANSINAYVRYWYTLDDDPATTIGTKVGIVDVFFNAGKCTPNTLGTVSNPKTLCVGESWDLRAAVINNNGGSFINLPFNELSDNITVNGTGVSGTSFSNNTSGIYTVNVKITYDNGEENFPITIKVLENPLVQNATNFKYGDGIIGGSTANQLEICQSDPTLNSTTIANTYFNNVSSTFYGNTAPTEFSWGLKSGSTSGAYVATGTSKNNTMNYSTLAPGDYYMELYHSFNSSTSNICFSKQYYFKVVIKPTPASILVTKDSFFICNNKENVNLVANTVSPTGVTWTGSGVTNNIFTGSSVSPNTYTITGSITGSNGCQKTKIITVVNKQGVSLTTIANDAICKNSSPMNLNAKVIVGDKGGKHFNALYPTTISQDSIFSPSIIGSHNIKYIKISSNGCSDTTNYSIVVNPTPNQPSFQKQVDSVCTLVGSAANNVSLTTLFNVSSGSGYTTTWNGNNQSNGIVNTNNLVPGNLYNYKYIQTTTSGCSDTTNFVLKSNNGSSSQITFTKTFDTICFSQNVYDLKIYNKTVVNGQWILPSANQAVQNNSELSMNFIENNKITQINYSGDTLGCHVGGTISIFKYKPDVYAGTDKTVCSNGSPIILGGQPSGGLWNVDTAATPVFIFDPANLSVSQSNVANNYNLYYSITSSFCTATDTAVYTVIKKPETTFATANDSICISSNSISNLSTFFGTTPNDGIWKGIGVVNGLEIRFNTTGIKDLKYVVSNTYGCVDTTSYTLRVDDNSDTNNIINNTDFKVCEASGPVNLKNFILTNKNNSIWTGQSIIDTQFFPTVTGVGNFMISYNYKSKTCNYTLYKKIVVVGKPTAPTINGSTKVCINQPILLSISSADPTLSYIWQNNTNGTSFNSILTSPGTINVSVKAKNYLNCESFATQVTVSTDHPTGELTQTKSSLDNSDFSIFNIINNKNIVNYNWNFGDGSDRSTMQSPKHYFYNPSWTSDITYNISGIITSSTGCNDTLKTNIIVRKRTKSSIIDYKSATIGVYPNPSTDFIIISSSNNDIVELKIYNVLGKIVYTDYFYKIGDKIDVSEFIAGTYIIQTKDTKQNISSSIKFIKNEK